MTDLQSYGSGEVFPAGIFSEENIPGSRRYVLSTSTSYASFLPKIIFCCLSLCLPWAMLLMSHYEPLA